MFVVIHTTQNTTQCLVFCTAEYFVYNPVMPVLWQHVNNGTSLIYSVMRLKFPCQISKQIRCIIKETHLFWGLIHFNSNKETQTDEPEAVVFNLCSL